MSPRRRGPRALHRDRGFVGWFAAAVVTLLLTAGVPMTTSAFTATVVNTGNSATAKARFTCGDTFAGQQRKQRAYFEFAFDEESGATTARDSSDAGNPGTYQGSNTKDTSAPTACPYDGGGAYRLDGSTSRVTTSKYFDPILTSFSVEAWFRTSSPGKILGFQSTVDGGSSNYDKHLYVSKTGYLVYGIFNGGTQTLFSPGTVTDGAWHHAVGTTGPKGSTLYLDGAAVTSNESFTTAEYFGGYWRLGQGNLGAWPDTPDDVGNAWLTGSLRFAAAYPYVLTADEVASEWSIGQPGLRAMKPTRPVQDPGTATATETAVPASSAPATAGSTATTAQAEPATAGTLDEDQGAVSIAG